jgi:hypothetical protein
MTATAENHVKPHICEMCFNITFSPRPIFSGDIFPWGRHSALFSVFGPTPCNLTCLAWCTFLHVAVGSHLPCSTSFLHGWIVLPAFIRILLYLTQLRNAQFVAQYNRGHPPEGMSALRSRAPCWPMEESDAPCTTGRWWLVSSGKQNRTELSRTLSNLCTWYSVVTNPIRSWRLLLKVLKSDLRVGHSLYSSTADDIIRGTAEDHVKPLDNRKLFLKTFRPSVRLSVTPSKIGTSSYSTITICLCWEYFCRHELPWFFVQSDAPAELEKAD